MGWEGRKGGVMGEGVGLGWSCGLLLLLLMLLGGAFSRLLPTTQIPFGSVGCVNNLGQQRDVGSFERGCVVNFGDGFGCVLDGGKCNVRNFATLRRTCVGVFRGRGWG